MDATTLPTWAVFLMSIGSPVLAFLGVLLASWLTRRTAHELEARSKREETMRTLRWAAELSASDQPNLAQLGVAELVALDDSDLLDDGQKVFVDAALESAIHTISDVIERIEAGGDQTDVVEDIDDAPSAPG